MSYSVPASRVVLSLSIFIACASPGLAVEASVPRASLAEALIPADVLSAAKGLSPADRAKFCPSDPIALLGIERLDPVIKIQGFTSRMKDDNVEGAKEAEKFVGVFGAHAVSALVNQDDAMKHRLIALLAKWATAGAFLKSESCVGKAGQLITNGKCGEWRVPDGSDLSSMKDATFSTFLAVGLMRAYYIALADAAPEMAAEHGAIKAWIDKISLRLKRPQDVYFGLNMGWYWPSITLDLAAGRTKQAMQKLKVLEQGLIRLVNDDGSIKDRTTRGDRALWYHHSGTYEIVMSMELMRAAKMPISPKLEKKLHAAVALFVAAIDDETILDKWARERHNAKYAGKQDWDWRWWPNEDFDGSWFHIYPYRYPEATAAIELRRLVPITAESATHDTDFGVGIGCIYNAATAIGGTAAEDPPATPLSTK
jgi:hypothetical protein